MKDATRSSKLEVVAMAPGAPSSAFDSSRRPPCAPAIASTIASPSPAPWAPGTKRSPERSTTSDGKPGPSSRTSTTEVPFGALTVTVTSCPACRTALSTRFVTARVSAAASPTVTASPRNETATPSSSPARRMLSMACAQTAWRSTLVSGGGPAARVRASSSRLTASDLEPLDLLERRLDRGADGRAVARQWTSQLQLAARDRDRCAELVARVVEEGTLVVERRLDPRQHVVQVAGELGELGRALYREPTAPGDRQRVRLRDHRAHRPERGTDDEPRGADDDHRERGERDRERQRELILRALVLVERRPDDHDDALGSPAARNQPAAARCSRVAARRVRA